MANERTLSLLLKFGLDDKSRKTLETNLAASRKSLEKMRSEAAKTEKALQEALKAGSDEAPRLKKELESISASIRDIETDARATFADQFVSAARQSAEETQNLADRTQRLGIALAAVGGAGLLALGGLASKYSEFVGMSEATSRSWIETSDRIEQAQVRLGRASAQALQPWRDALAGILEQAADFAESNQGTISGLAAGAIAAAGAGGGIAAISEGIKLVADAKFLSAAALQNKAAQDMLRAAGIQAGAASTMTTGGVAGGAAKAGLLGAAGAAAATVGGGLLVGNAIGKQINGGTGIEHFAAIGAYGVGSLIGGEEKANQFFTAVGRLTGALDESTAAAMDAAMGEKELAQSRILPGEAVDAYIAYRQAETQAEEQYGQQRAQIVEDFAQQRRDIEEQYETRRTDIVEQYASRRAEITENYERRQAEAEASYSLSLERQARDFANNEARIQEDYYRQRSEMAQDYHEDVRRAEEDHQRRMRQMQADHDTRMDDLIASRDALGVVNEMRDYERQRQQAEEDHQLDMQRRSQDFSEQLRDMESNFRLQRQRRLEDYQQRLDDQQADFDAQQEKAQEAYEEQLADLENAEQEQLDALERGHKEQLSELEQHKRNMLASIKQQYLAEKNARDQAFRDQLRQLNVFTSDQMAAWNEFYDRMRDELGEFIEDMTAEDITVPNTSTSAGSGATGQSKAGRASGGYARYGSYTLGERGEEFVLSHETTRAAERMAGSRLTQRNVLGAGSGMLVVNLHLPGGQMSIRDRRSLIASSRDAALDGLARALEMVQ